MTNDAEKCIVLVFLRVCRELAPSPGCLTGVQAKCVEMVALLWDEGKETTKPQKTLKRYRKHRNKALREALLRQFVENQTNATSFVPLCAPLCLGIIPSLRALLSLRLSVTKNPCHPWPILPRLTSYASTTFTCICLTAQRPTLAYLAV